MKEIKVGDRFRFGAQGTGGFCFYKYENEVNWDYNCDYRTIKPGFSIVVEEIDPLNRLISFKEESRGLRSKRYNLDFFERDQSVWIPLDSPNTKPKEKTETTESWVPIKRKDKHYKELEDIANGFEKIGYLQKAREVRILANLFRPTDIAMDAEEDALKAKRFLMASDFNAMSKTDQLAWGLKGLKQSRYYSDQVGAFLYWEIK